MVWLLLLAYRFSFCYCLLVGYVFLVVDGFGFRLFCWVLVMLAGGCLLNSVALCFIFAFFMICFFG